VNTTPLYAAHQAAGAKLVDFAGWSMPLHYSGVIDEYKAVRYQAGLFDVSHMGRITISGNGALPFLQFVTTNDVAQVQVNRSQYSMVCNPKGGVKDDVFLYRLSEQEYLLCVNASNHAKIFAWLQEVKHQVTQPFDIKDCSEEMAQLALQGPGCQMILSAALKEDLTTIKPRGCLHTKFLNDPLLITRTGYTGEIGVELYLSSSHATSLWDRLIESGVPYGLKPAGLGARDLLRLDMGYFLYGNELTEETTPVEAGAEWAVDFQKDHFIGSSILVKQREEGPPRRLIAFELVAKGVPRHGMGMYRDDHCIGEVTSGNLSPILQKGIGLGYVASEFADDPNPLSIDIRGKRLAANRVAPPFYHRRATNRP